MADYAVQILEPDAFVYAPTSVVMNVIGVTSGVPVTQDTEPPVIDNYSPSPGTEIESNDPLQFDVTDNLSEFRRIIVEAYFQSTGQSEIIHNGDAFRPYYSGSSTRSYIELGYRYVVRRLGGWPAAPTINVYAIDEDGNEGV